MLRPIFNKSQVAFLYYKRVTPDRNYTARQASNQFLQDKNIDKSILLEIIMSEVTKQAKEL